jgi:biopolymer transport protein ExbD
MALSLPPTGEATEDQYRDRYQPIAEINVTPMVDVMLVFLIIFMVTAPLLTVGVPLDLPKTSAAQVTQPNEPIVLSLDREGGTFIGNERVDPANLRDRLSRLAAGDAGRIVYVRGDRTISYARLMDALGLVNGAGFTSPRGLSRSEPLGRLAACRLDRRACLHSGSADRVARTGAARSVACANRHGWDRGHARAAAASCRDAPAGARTASRP